MRQFAKIRESLGIDVGWASVLLGVSPTYLRRLERGALPLPHHLAVKMSVVYGCSVYQLTTVAH